MTRFSQVILVDRALPDAAARLRAMTSNFIEAAGRFGRRLSVENMPGTASYHERTLEVELPDDVDRVAFIAALERPA